MSSAALLTQSLTLPSGGVVLRNRLALAPMAGMTDVPFRTLAWSFGAGHMVSEMITSKPELWDTGKSRSRRVLIDSVTPQAVQIAGFDPEVMADSARRLVDDGVELIDINFGCPAKKVCHAFANCRTITRQNGDAPLRLGCYQMSIACASDRKYRN